MITDLQIAKEYLKNAILYRYSEIPINEYIRFMDGLPKYKREKIFFNPEITKLIDNINEYTDGEIELNKIHGEV